ncbi:MAG: zinc-binding dehydrogenase [Bacteroidales bacterium]|nr:zinc-binding dehydrogenase [Bacteroidales bacterium]
MKAVIQEKPGDLLYIKDIPIPEPSEGEVLVKMSFAPVNPSDLSLLKGTYAGSPLYPLVPGMEGSGLVVKSGKGIIARSREGKRVACTASGQSNGTWAEYMVTSALRTITLDKHIDDEQGSMLLVNPLTAVAFIEIAQKEKITALVNNAGASSLGKMLISLCRENNIDLINIVSREAQRRNLKELGASYVLNSSAPDFENELARYSDMLGARLFFDAVGGKQAEIMLKASPPGSTVITYAKLSEQNISVDPRLLLQQDKKIRGFYLANYISGKSIIHKLRATGKAKKLISGQNNIRVSARYPLEKVNEALDYYRNNMSSGKVLLYP